MSAPFDRRITAARPDLAAAHLEGMIAAPRYVTGTIHAVTAPSVPLRREPRPDVPFDTELLHGEWFTVYDTDGEGWCWGQAEADGYVGWLPVHALGPAAPPAPTHRVSVLRTFLYPAPSIKHPPVTFLSFGARLVVTGETGAFASVDGGHVWRCHLVPVDTVCDDPVDVAAAFVGIPYLWGGRTSLGLDCSALVQTALRACGRPAPRDSDMQERALGVAIDPAGPLRRGDLVFWKGHVGLMRDGETLLHANGHTMSVGEEKLETARARVVAAGSGPVSSIRRFEDSPRPSRQTAL